MLIKQQNITLFQDKSLPLMIKPTIVDYNRVVSNLLVASSDQHICHLQKHGGYEWCTALKIRYSATDLFEQILSDAELRVVVTVCVAPEALPWEPTHWGSQAQTIVQTWNATLTHIGNRV